MTKATISLLEAAAVSSLFTGQYVVFPLDKCGLLMYNIKEVSNTHLKHRMRKMECCSASMRHETNNK